PRLFGLAGRIWWGTQRRVVVSPARGMRKVAGRDSAVSSQTRSECAPACPHSSGTTAAAAAPGRVAARREPANRPPLPDRLVHYPLSAECSPAPAARSIRRGFLLRRGGSEIAACATARLRQRRDRHRIVNLPSQTVRGRGRCPSPSGRGGGRRRGSAPVLPRPL